MVLILARPSLLNVVADGLFLQCCINTDTSNAFHYKNPQNILLQPGKYYFFKKYQSSVQY